MSKLLLLLFSGYIRLRVAVVSFTKIAIGCGFGYCSWRVIAWGWYAPSSIPLICFGISGYLLLIAINLVVKSLPGITPRPQGYRPGRATTAGLDDLRKAGILK